MSLNLCMLSQSNKYKNINVMTDFNLNTRPKKQPFSVPQGYFDTLTENVMRRIPSEDNSAHTIPIQARTSGGQQHISIWKRLAWVPAAAAVLLLAFFTIQKGEGSLEPGQSPMQGKKTATAKRVPSVSNEDNYQNDVLEYAMVDQNDIYYYLSGTEY